MADLYDVLRPRWRHGGKQLGRWHLALGKMGGCWQLVRWQRSGRNTYLVATVSVYQLCSQLVALRVVGLHLEGSNLRAVVDIRKSCLARHMTEIV